MRPRARALRATCATCAALAGPVGCSAGEFAPRPVVLVSREPAVDEGLAAGRRLALDHDFDGAEAALRALIEQHPSDATVPAAKLLLARVMLARGDVDAARETAQSAEVSVDPALRYTLNLVLGCAAARSGQYADALELLRPLEGQLPDRGETWELSCALAEAESRAGDPQRALRALSLSETLFRRAELHLPTGMSCEQPSSQLALLESLAARVNDPQTLADAIDAMPQESPLRAPLAVRLQELAEALGEMSRWRAWMQYLPDDRGSQAPVVPAARESTLVVGVLAPTTGPRAAAGVSVLRGVGYALEPVAGARVVPEDEGSSPADAVAALDRLVGQGARAVVGVIDEDHSAAVAIRAQSLGVDLWLLAPVRGVERSGARVHAAGPAVEVRATALAALARGRGGRAVVVLPDAPTEVHERLARELGGAGAAAERMGPLAAARAGGATFVVAGTFGREAAHAMARAAQGAPGRWVFEARSAEPGAAGVWVGLASGPALGTVVRQFCERTGAPPDEYALLAYDAARAAAAAARGNSPGPSALAGTTELLSATVRPGQPPDERAPAATARCPSAAAGEH